MKLNQSKCEHIGLNAIHRIQYDNGKNSLQHKQLLTYLGARVQNNGDHKAEVKARTSAAWVTVMRLDLFWRKALVRLKWERRVLDSNSFKRIIWHGNTGHLTIRLRQNRCIPNQDF